MVFPQALGLQSCRWEGVGSIAKGELDIQTQCSLFFL
jgi:hypothetical protein